MANTHPGSSSIPSALSRRGFLTLGTGSMAAFLAGCGGGQGVGQAPQGGGSFSGKYTGPNLMLAYWNGFTAADGTTMRKLVSGFDHEHKNIAIKNNTIEWATFYQRLPAAVNAGSGPDVGAMHLDQLATNAARKVIVPLDDVAKQIKLEQSDFTPAVWGPGIWNGNRYGIPLDVHCLTMYWNKDHFKKAGINEPPADAASFDEACKTLQAAGYDTPFWMPNQWPAHLMFLSLLWQYGGEPYAEDGSRATWGSEAGVKALTWMVDQVKKGYSPQKVDIDAQYLAFKNGKTSITWDGIWQITDLEASGMSWDMAAIPTIGDKPASWANSHNFFMTKKAAEDQNRSDASKVFISWISDQSSEWSGAGMIPARNSARQQPAFTKSRQAVLDDYLENLHFLPPIPGVGDISPQTLEVAVNEAVLGKTSVQEALSKYSANATKLMEQNKAKFGG